MSNPRGPMVPHELRAQLDNARQLRAGANGIETLATIIANRESYTQDQFETAVVIVEKIVHEISIIIRRIKDEPR